MHEHTYGPSETGTVVLELGGETGALILYTGPDLRGREIEISRGDDRRVHSAVRERRVRDGSFHSAVYPDLPAGIYTVWWDEGTSAGTVSVHGGAIAEFVWPTSGFGAAG
ncbi:phospholipase [Micromonospora sp. NPDC093244]|uniref:phospholipase n=1 Tax=Micromonospora sp. NPDC093244 TaxID=3155071 RepID=UPI00341933BE